MIEGGAGDGLGGNEGETKRAGCGGRCLDDVGADDACAGIGCGGEGEVEVSGEALQQV